MRLLRHKASLLAMGAAAMILPQSYAGTFTANFNDGSTPAGSTLNGTPPNPPTAPPGSGIIEEGVLKLTKNVNGQSGSLVINDLDGGNPVYGFHLTAKVRIGGGTATPADGMGFTFSPTLAPESRPGHDGVGAGITFVFDQYDNGTGEGGISAPAIEVRVNGQVVAWKKVTFNDIRTGAEFVPVDLLVEPDGAVSMSFKGQQIFNKVYFPGYEPISGGLFALHANTGGLNENYWVDDLSITTFTAPQVGVINPPASQTLLAGTTLNFAPTINNAEGATYQWLKNGQPIENATEATYTTTAALVDSGATYQLRVTGPNNTVTTAPATVNVIEIVPPAATASFNFNDGQVPAGTLLVNEAHIGEDLVSLHLTDAANDQNGAFIIEDLAAGAPVYGITATFKAQVWSPGTPADGFAFSFGPNISEGGRPEHENGLGTGLVVGFDTYNNADFEAPSVDVRFGGLLIAQTKVPISYILTGTDETGPATDVIIRLESDGTLDVSYKGQVIFHNLAIPAFGSFSGARIALGARTGGANEAVWIDDINIALDTTPGAVRIITQPLAQYVLAGQTATFNVAVNDSTGVTYQWLKNGQPIQGATEATYSFTTAAGDTGATYSVRATKAGVNVDSVSVPLTVITGTPNTVLFDFNSGVPAGQFLTGNVANESGYVSDTGGVNDSGVLHLTDAINDRRGAFVVQPLLEGAELSALTAIFDLRLGGGSANSADGMSFNFAPNLPQDTTPGEEGVGNGLTIAFDIYDNGGGEAPSVDVKWRGQTIAVTKLLKSDVKTDDAEGNPAFKTVIIKLTAEGKVDVAFGGRVLHSGVQLPNYAPTANGKIGIYARTGGLNENMWIDNLILQATKNIAPLRITLEPGDALVLPGQTATFTASVSDPAGVTYQWFRNGQPIQGATSASYTTGALTTADSGATFSLTATGPGGTPSSRTAVLTVAAPLTIGTPTHEYNFNDGVQPEGTVAHGRVDDPVTFPIGGYVTGDGGVDNTGVFHLTDNINGQGGSFYIQNAGGENAVSGFTANFKLRIGGGSAVPADGVSFNWSDGINPDDLGENLGEDGNGSGLTVAIDIYDNAGGEAPAIDLIWKGQILASRKMPIAALSTDSFVDVWVRVEPDGTADVQYNNTAIFHNVALPGFAPMTGSHFAIAGRTGGLNANQWIDDVKLQVNTDVQGPTLTISRNQDGTIRIEWAGGGTLEATDALGTTWTPLTGVNSPANLPTTGGARFFRVAQ